MEKCIKYIKHSIEINGLNVFHKKYANCTKLLLCPKLLKQQKIIKYKMQSKGIRQRKNVLCDHNSLNTCRPDM